ncbi:MAG: holin, BlyA family protein [Clostridiales bacterium]|nr:holin, BlyA family protein [Clostridiales bacterium]
MHKAIKQVAWEFWSEEDGLQSVEIIILGVALITIASIFKDKMSVYIESCFEVINSCLTTFTDMP